MTESLFMSSKNSHGLEWDLHRGNLYSKNTLPFLAQIKLLCRNSFVTKIIHSACTGFMLHMNFVLKRQIQQLINPQLRSPESSLLVCKDESRLSEQKQATEIQS